MMNRALLKAPLRYPQVARALAFRSSTGVYHQTFPTCSIYKFSRRTLTSNSCLASDRPPSSQFPPNPPVIEENDPTTQNQAAEPSQHIPWYLQEETPLPAAEISSRQQIPELPENPPKILPVLLEYVFKDLGLDDLRLFDLRDLETPPALGANVIMIIGTTRSVKHLNVSADRLCRWLRSTWKLSPYADGLLGRNELKIKLRRKARRARLASRTGTIFDDKDDGITTGWICVNAGVVEKTPIQEKPDPVFEGFGTLGVGTRVVVQLFTEEKREEVDLDGLWEQNLARAERARQTPSKIPSDAPEEVRSPNSMKTSPSDREIRHVTRPSVSLPLDQRRQFHSRSRLQHSDLEQEVDGAQRAIASQPPRFSDPLEPRNEADSGFHTRSLFERLLDLPDKRVRRELGSGLEDENSTLFLRLFYDSLARSSVEDKALAQVELACIAISRQHPGYTKESLHLKILGCFASGCFVSEELTSQVVLALLTAHPAPDKKSKPWLPDSDKEAALSVLDHMSLRGMDVLTLKFFNKLYTAASLPTTPDNNNNNNNSSNNRNVSGGAKHIAQLLDILDVPFDPEQARIHMMLRFRNGDFDGFWKWWRKLPLLGSPRTYEDYETLFKLHAVLKDRLRARDCASTWVPMMSREDPPIPLEGELLHNVMYCIVVAEPEIEKQVEEGSTSALAQLWEECQMRIQE
ncbi:hypothetical protein AOCH_006400 [Aspergillus ochraceoroseus]|uniref:ATPase synthesis protein 25 n=1 Tax=Aspergillus ochraceoroseus TaxID=138278 RepID=A0A0F8WSN0_9EURO|nr:hypothetical protein AOCH_006400 [Aspergillus ochraceoroseus]